MAESQNRTLTEQFMLRLPDGMRDRIKDAAAANNRSMNAEIVATLEEKYPAPSFDAGAAAREYRDLAMILAFEGASPAERAAAVERLNEIERRYKEATGEDI